MLQIECLRCLIKRKRVNGKNFISSFGFFVSLGFETSRKFLFYTHSNITLSSKFLGLSQEEWEEKGWINNQDPRGWFQWYCRYFLGRRTDDDERQIQRWNNFCGEKGRWRNYIYSKIFNKGTTIEDLSFSLAVRQSLLHWGYMINNDDFDMWKLKN